MSSLRDTINFKRFDKTVKSQISSIKLQINLNFQYSMTKTFTIVVSHRFANPGVPVMMPLGTTVDGKEKLKYYRIGPI